jgi:hypothetical protein
VLSGKAHGDDAYIERWMSDPSLGGMPDQAERGEHRDETPEEK